MRVAPAPMPATGVGYCAEDFSSFLNFAPLPLATSVVPGFFTCLNCFVDIIGIDAQEVLSRLKSGAFATCLRSGFPQKATMISAHRSRLPRLTPPTDPEWNVPIAPPPPVIIAMLRGLWPLRPSFAGEPSAVVPPHDRFARSSRAGVRRIQRVASGRFPLG